MSEYSLEDALAYASRYDYEKASGVVVKLLQNNPNNLAAWALRGDILFKQDAYFDALLHYDRVTAKKDDEWAAWLGKGNCFTRLRWWNEAEAAFKKSLSICRSYDGYMGLAILYFYLMRLEESASCYKQAISIENNQAAIYSLGTILLALGQWEEGFKLYKSRWDSPLMAQQIKINLPEWDGDKDKSVIMYTEGGYGDEVSMMRFAKYGSALEVRPPMTRLAKSLGVKTITKGDEITSDIGYTCSAFDVPGILGITWHDIDRKPYLKANRQWKLPDGYKVGLCWMAGIHLLTDAFSRLSKSVDIEDYRCFMRDDVVFVSLQKPTEKVPRDMPILDFTNDLHDFEDTASLISGLNLVITVDTAVAHLAGALGKPVWNFVRHDGCWPWMATKVLPSPEYSVWYESMRLFRQKKPFDWSHPLKQAAKEFHELVNDRISRT